MNEPSEKDYLQYRGNKIPRVIRFAWTALALFGVYYIVTYALPDLKVWLAGGTP